MGELCFQEEGEGRSLLRGSDVRSAESTPPPLFFFFFPPEIDALAPARPLSPRHGAAAPHTPRLRLSPRWCRLCYCCLSAPRVPRSPIFFSSGVLEEPGRRARPRPGNSQPASGSGSCREWENETVPTAGRWKRSATRVPGREKRQKEGTEWLLPKPQLSSGDVGVPKGPGGSPEDAPLLHRSRLHRWL